MSVDLNPLDASSILIDKFGMATSYFEDYLYNKGLSGDAVSNSSSSSVSVTSPDASDLASVITLANELKSDLTILVTDLNASITQLNALLASLRDAGALDE